MAFGVRSGARQAERGLRGDRRVGRLILDCLVHLVTAGDCSWQLWVHELSGMHDPCRPELGRSCQSGNPEPRHMAGHQSRYAPATGIVSSPAAGGDHAESIATLRNLGIAMGQKRNDAAITEIVLICSPLFTL